MINIYNEFSMKILITGGYGFIGSSLIRKILKETNHKILNLDSLTYASNQDSLKNIDKPQNYTFLKVIFMIKTS